MQDKPTPKRRVIERVRVKPGIYKRKGADGRDRFEVVYRGSDGKQRRETIAGGIRAAEDRLAQVRVAKSEGETVAPNPRLTFERAAQEWLRSAEVRLRPATLNAYRSSLETHLLPRFARTRLDKLNTSSVRKLVEDMQRPEYRAAVEQRVWEAAERKAGRNPNRKRDEPKVTTGYRAWTIRGVLVPLGLIFDFAWDELGYRGDNPVRRLRTIHRPKHEHKERRILSRDELAKVIEAADEPYRTIIATGAGLGTRLGETLGLRWQDIDLENGTATIRNQVDRGGTLVPLKTARSRRVVEMPGSVVSALRRHKLKSPKSKPSDLVFTSRTGGAMEHRNVAQRGLGRAYKRAKLDGRAPTFHELRHAHASAWIAAGGDIVELSSRLGHRDPSVTASIYSHEFEAAARSAERRDRLDAIYGRDERAPLKLSS